MSDEFGTISDRIRSALSALITLAERPDEIATATRYHSLRTELEQLLRMPGEHRSKIRAVHGALLAFHSLVSRGKTGEAVDQLRKALAAWTAP